MRSKLVGSLTLVASISLMMASQGNAYPAHLEPCDYYSYSQAYYAHGMPKRYADECCQPRGAGHSYTVGGALAREWRSFYTKGYAGYYDYYSSGGSINGFDPEQRNSCRSPVQAKESAEADGAADTTPESEPVPRSLAYAVNSGDTIFQIAKSFGISAQTLMDYNRIDDPTKLRIGHNLQIPTPQPAAEVPEKHKIVKVLASTLTAYTAGYESTGKTPSHPEYGLTYSGVRAAEGRTVAVDPSVIPLGSTILIEGIGIRQAEDTGSAIRGSKIDVYMEDVRQALKFGVKKSVKVYVLSERDA